MSYMAQLGLLLIVVGGFCAAEPYSIAKWHENDVESQSRLFKRAQGHKKKKDRVAFDSSEYDGKKEPTKGLVTVVRALGIVAAIIGLIILVKES